MRHDNGFGPAIWAADFASYPEAVLALMGPMDTVPLDPGDLRRLAGQGGRIAPDTHALLAGALPRFAATGAHMRLGLCSFKTGPGRLLPIFTADQAATTLHMRNRRVAIIAAQMLTEGRDGLLYLRPYREFPRWTEFRLFIRNRAIVGISQYHLDRRYPEILNHAEAIRQALAAFNHRLLPALHQDTIVADVAVDPAGQALPLLIELNPFVARTGPGLFSWAGGGNFDGSFRIM
jgi:hypothetical protein